MKKTVIISMFCFLLGIILGWIINPSNVPTTSSEQEELVKWEKIKDSREQSAEEIFKKASHILGVMGFNPDYSNGNLEIKAGGMAFGDCWLSIYYKDTLVFDVRDGFWGGVGEINTFHPGEWISELESIDPEKEMAIQKTVALKENFGP